MGSWMTVWANILATVTVVGGILAAAWRVYQAWDDVADRVSIMVEEFGRHVKDESENTRTWREMAEHRMTTMEGRLSIVEGRRQAGRSRRAGR